MKIIPGAGQKLVFESQLEKDYYESFLTSFYKARQALLLIPKNSMCVADDLLCKVINNFGREYVSNQ